MKMACWHFNCDIYSPTIPQDKDIRLLKDMQMYASNRLM